MQEQQKHLGSLISAFFFKDKELEREFYAWKEPSSLIRIRAAAALTALLYILYAQLNIFVAPKEFLPLMTMIHLYFLAPFLLIISLLTYWKKLYPFTIFLLFIAPISAVIGNLLIVIKMQAPHIYLTEIYLILIWTFTVSGLTLFYATLSALTSFFIVLYANSPLLSLSHEIFIMHYFWMFATLSFGLLSAYLLEKSHRTIFLNEKQLIIELDHTKELEKKLKEFNDNLKDEIAVALQKSKEKDLVIFHQKKRIAMGEMIECIAHQWRQPLSQINSAVLIIDGTLNSMQIKHELLEEKLTEIESQTHYMSETINDFKNFFELNKESEPFVFEDLIKSTLSILASSLKEHGIVIEVNVHNHTLLQGHLKEMRQVILTIVNNAKHALLSRKTMNPKIIFNAYEAKDCHILSICDNAGGIKNEIMHKIFEPYVTTKETLESTGIGLYMSKIIIEDGMEGTLKAENSDIGACFTIELPKKLWY